MCWRVLDSSAPWRWVGGGRRAIGDAGGSVETRKIGSSLIGKLQGPEIILDAKAFPKTFKEAPTACRAGESREAACGR